jgi:hypothetical protein
MSEKPEDLELTALEGALRELHPRTPALDPAVLMYRAGRASARGWLWPLATLGATMLALVFGVLLSIRPAPPVVYVAVPPAGNEEVSPSPPSSPLADETERGAWSRYVGLQEQVLLYGLDGLPSPSSETEEPLPDAEALLNSL